LLFLSLVIGGVLAVLGDITWIAFGLGVAVITAIAGIIAAAR
jgi:hypothetical protein